MNRACAVGRPTPRMNFGGYSGGYQSLDYSTGGGIYGGGTAGGYSGGSGYIGGGGGFTSPGIGQSPAGDRKRSTKNQSIRPLVSAQLHQASLPSGDEQFQIDNEEVGQISLVGEIVEVMENPTSIMYKIDDRTGPPIEVRRWLNDEESPLELQRRSSCREGIYVKVIGHLRIFNKQQSVIGFFIKPIEDFNEVTHHLCETLYAHLAFNKGLPMPKQFADLQVGRSVGGGSGWTPMATSTQIGGASFSDMGRMDSGLNPVQKQVLNLIGQSRSNHGLHVNEVISLAKNHGFPEAKIRTAIDFLCNEGHIYSTIDDEHFKSTEDF